MASEKPPQLTNSAPDGETLGDLYVAESEAQFYQGVRSLLTKLPEGDDITLLTLKAHLVIEQLVIQILESAVRNPEPLQELNRLQFGQRVALAEAFTPRRTDRHGTIWPLVRKVGKIRNDIAHQLEPRELNEHIEEFLGLYIRFFGAKTSGRIAPEMRGSVTRDNYLIPPNIRTGTLAQRYRNALAGTAQGVAGTLAAVRDITRTERSGGAETPAERVSAKFRGSL